jgi:hypothetical protein
LAEFYTDRSIFSLTCAVSTKGSHIGERYREFDHSLVSSDEKSADSTPIIGHIDILYNLNELPPTDHQLKFLIADVVLLPSARALCASARGGLFSHFVCRSRTADDCAAWPLHGPLDQRRFPLPSRLPH